MNAHRSSTNAGADALRFYFAQLDAGDVDAALSVFAADAVYFRGDKLTSGEPGSPTARVLAASYGQVEIAAFVREQARISEARGVRPRHDVLMIEQVGRVCVAEGVVRGPERGLDVIFFAHAVFDDDGLISQYAAVSNESPKAVTDALEQLRTEVAPD